MATRKGITTPIRAAIGATLLVLGLNAVASFSATWTLISNQKMVEHTQTVLGELEATIAAVSDLETGVRGYMITDRPNFLDPYNASRLEIDFHIARLEELVADNPEQAARVDALKQLIYDRRRDLEEILTIYKQEGFERAQQRMRRGAGKDLMEEIRRVVSDLKNAEYALLEQRSTESRSSGVGALLTISIASVLSLGLVVLVHFLLLRDVQLRAASEQALREARDQLERRVQERTVELSQANEELNEQVAARERARLQLMQFTAELERSNRELQDFAFVASHDLQEPLRKIQAFGDRLQRKYLDALGEEGRDYVARMQGAARRMNALINDLLTFSRVTSKAQPFTPVDLATITRDVVSDLEGRLLDTQGSVDVGLLPTIDADPLQMRQLLQNLIGNALKFHRPGVPPQVVVQGFVDNGRHDVPQCVLEVKDNGIGFDEKYLDRIFTPFQRLHNRNEYEGTGMGLAVCRKIVERHGGSITARSTLGEGTTFLITLPVAQSAAAES